MILASWNVNSVKARLEHLQRWLATVPVDVLMLQEIKTEAAGFPAAALVDIGFTYQQVVGEKSYNGVALLSRMPITHAVSALPSDAADSKARFVGGCIGGVWCYNLYAPNGNPVGTEKFTYKLAWLQRLHAFAAAELAQEKPVVFAGDYNIIPTSADAATPATWADDALYQPQPRAAFAAMTNLGYADAYRIYHPDDSGYTFYDYRAGAWQNNDGIRIDHFMLSPEATDRAKNCWIDTTPRGWDTPSDHVPVVVELG